MSDVLKPLVSAVLLVLATWAWLGCIAGCEGSDSAHQLFSTVMANYNPLIRPVKNTSDILDLYIGLTLSQLVDVDEKNQVMITSIWLKQKWKDYKLKWNPADYDGLKQMQIPIDLIWSPDIVLYNTADGDYAVNVGNSATVRYDGTVLWNPPATFRSSCIIDISYFPFDEQRCKMKFGSWTYDGLVVDLKPLSHRVERENYRANGEWNIVESPIEQHAIKYPCCDEIYLDVTYTFVLHRNSLFYVITLVLPCVLIDLLTVLVFYLPSAAQEKITLSISVLLALVVFLLLIPSIIPPNSTTVPLIARYMLFTMAMVSVSIVATVWTINIHFRNINTHVMGRWTEAVFLNALPRLMMMQHTGATRERRRKPRLKQRDSGRTRSNVSSPDATTAISAEKNDLSAIKGDIEVYNKMTVESTMSPSLREEIEHRDRSTSLQKPDDCAPISNEWKELLEHLQYIKDDTEHTDMIDNSEEDWKFVGLVIDKCLLVVFSIVVVVSTAILFLQTPIVWERHGVHHHETYEEPEVLISAGYYDLFPPVLTTPEPAHSG